MSLSKYRFTTRIDLIFSRRKNVLKRKKGQWITSLVWWTLIQAAIKRDQIKITYKTINPRDCQNSTSSLASMKISQTPFSIFIIRSTLMLSYSFLWENLSSHLAALWPLLYMVMVFHSDKTKNRWIKLWARRKMIITKVKTDTSNFLERENRLLWSPSDIQR